MEESQKQELANQLQDVFNIYLDTDIAGDNSDRRNKLHAFTTVLKIIEAQ